MSINTRKVPMKNLLAIALFVVTFPAYSQSPQKVGHADWEYIFNKLPEYRQIEKELGDFELMLQKQLDSKRQELDGKYKAYLALPKDTPDPIKKDKETELAYLQENIRKFQQDAQSSMQAKQSALAGPVFQKVAKAIEEVAKENGFSYIFNPQMIGGGDVLLFSDEKFNISDLVLRKLGIAVATSD